MGRRIVTADTLIATTGRLVADGKGLLAADESNGTCDKRLAEFDIPQTSESRRSWRALLFTTPDLATSISGVIVYDETIRQASDDGTAFVEILNRAGMLCGIKVDSGTTDLAGHQGEKITEGLDGLGARLRDYFRMGARFAKWRAVFSALDGRPSRACIAANAQSLARYAALCQENGLVPIVEPELLMAGAHGLADCAAITEEILLDVFHHLAAAGIQLESMLLKPNMVLPGESCAVQDPADRVASATLRVLSHTVPAAVGGIAFLSGGQSARLATERLDAINRLADRPDARAPWPLTFSFGRALQQPALALWRGQAANRSAAQSALHHRAQCNRAVRLGNYSEAMETCARASI